MYLENIVQVADTLKFSVSEMITQKPVVLSLEGVLDHIHSHYLPILAGLSLVIYYLLLQWNKSPYSGRSYGGSVNSEDEDSTERYL